jgi:spermidine/putrescine transport system ATP-binding protein
MDVLNNVAFGPRRRGVRKPEAMQRALEALALVGLESFSSRMPSELSGGQQQRVALARAIVNEPRLLLLDEPLSALDLQLRKRMQLELKHLQARLGIAFILVTHDQEEAMSMADTIIVMNGGRIEQQGAGPVIYKKPKTRFVAEFIGEANIVSVGAHADGLFGLAYPPLPACAPDAHNLVAVIRPEHVSVSQRGNLESRNGVAGIIEHAIDVGSHTSYHIRCADMILVARVTGQEGLYTPGDEVAVTVSPEHIHLIPARQ